MKRERCREFKAGDYNTAFNLFEKALRYLDMHPQMPEDASPEAIKSYEAL